MVCMFESKEIIAISTTISFNSLQHLMQMAVSYTHLTLPTNSRV